MQQRPENVKASDKSLEPIVFWTSVLLIGVFVGLAFHDPKSLGSIFASTQDVFSTNVGWFYILVVNSLVVFCFWLMLSKVSTIRLGGTKAKPQFPRATWFAMLFSAGMGIGLVFWSVAEPVYHYAELPPLFAAGTGGAGAALSPENKAQAALTISMFHWGIHAWAIYAVIALALAYFAYNRGLPLTIRSVFHPILGDRIYGWPGHVIDITAVLATLFGLATSLGLGASQINAGLNRLFDIPKDINVQILLIGAITAIAILSVVSGLERGIRRLSELNMIAAAALMLFVFAVGPTLFLIDASLQNIGYYIQNLPRLATWTEAYTGSSWQHNWTIFYWAWWIAWSPFVGMFIARISYGRTVREFVMAVLLVPTLLTIFWMTVFGGTALHEVIGGSNAIVTEVKSDVSTAIFALLDNYPFAEITSGLAIFVIVVFFVTSSDSGSLVIDTITSGGHPHPPVAQKIFWATTEGVVAAALLLAGGLKALQAGAILTGFPFAIVLLGMCFALAKGLSADHDANSGS
jgi:choline/glycine/proline betaine transport protein